MALWLTRSFFMMDWFEFLYYSMGWTLIFKIALQYSIST